MSPVHYQLFHMHAVDLFAPPEASTISVEDGFWRGHHETCSTCLQLLSHRFLHDLMPICHENRHTKQRTEKKSIACVYYWHLL